MNNKIDCGYCINNDSPYDNTYCDCYKVSIPYMIFEHSGVINICRSWFNYVLKQNYETNDYKYVEISNFLVKEILERYPDLKEDGIKLQSYFTGDYYRNSRGLRPLEYCVIGKPYHIRAYFMPSYLLSKIKEDEWFSRYNKYTNCDIRNGKIVRDMGHEDKFYRDMVGLSRRNYYNLREFITEVGKTKKNSELFKEFIKKIEKL